MRSARSRSIFVLTIGVMVAALAVAGPAIAKGPGNGNGGSGGHHGTGGTTGGSGSFSLVLLNSTDGLPHYGQDVTFNVSAAVTYPWVRLDCYQGTTWAFGQDVGFYAAYPWS